MKAWQYNRKVVLYSSIKWRKIFFTHFKKFCQTWKTFKDIKMFKGHVYETYKEACRAMRLPENYNKFYDCIVESAFWASVLLYCEVTNP